jgi:RNA polymerase sigma-70 factor (ECF subfamily)
VGQRPNEQALLKRAKQYDEAALGELYDRYAPRIYGYIYRRVGDPHLAEDLAGDVFVRVVQSIRSRRGWHTSFLAWLYRIAHNVVVDHYRRPPEALFASLDEMGTPAEEAGPERAVEDALDRARLRAAIGCLTQGQQQVLVLRFGEGLSVRETARVLNKTSGAVKATQHRALDSMRRILTKEAMPGEKAGRQAGEPTKSVLGRGRVRANDLLTPGWESPGTAS